MPPSSTKIECEGCVQQLRGQVMKAFWNRLGRDQRGATAVEYGLILALIFLAMVGAVGQFSNEVIGVWGTVESTSEDAIERTGT